MGEGIGWGCSVNDRLLSLGHVSLRKESPRALSTGL